MSSLLLLPLSTAEESAGMGPYLIGGATLLLLLGMLFALLAFGQGREHS